MTKRRTITGVAIALFAAVATAAIMRSHYPMGTWLSQSAQPEIERPILLVSEPNGAKKPVRYEATRENWKRYRSANDRPSP
jgi:hypothetical protein